MTIATKATADCRRQRWCPNDDANHAKTRAGRAHHGPPRTAARLPYRKKLENIEIVVFLVATSYTIIKIRTGPKMVNI